jgi:hypothetical protein
MSGRRKFIPGARIHSLNQFALEIEAGHGVYHNHKYAPMGWAISWQFRFVLQAIRRGDLYCALSMEMVNAGLAIPPIPKSVPAPAGRKSYHPPFVSRLLMRVEMASGEETEPPRAH